MKKNLVLLMLFLCVATQAQNTVTISGYVTDFEGNPISGSDVDLVKSFSGYSDYVAVSDENGYYKLEGVVPGEYLAICAMIPDEYPRMNAVPEEDMRLEFWAWNVIADRDLELNIRYHRLELYGTTVYELYGSYPGYFVYFRPMSLEKVLSDGKDIYLDKQKAEEKGTDISVVPEFLEVKVYADDELLKINSIQPVIEYVGDDKGMGAYLLQVDRPVNRTDRPYIIFRVVATNTEFGEKGENIYFYRIPEFYR